RGSGGGLGLALDRLVEAPLPEAAAAGRPPHGPGDSGPGDALGKIPPVERIEHPAEARAQRGERVLRTGGRPRPSLAQDLDGAAVAPPDPDGHRPRPPAAGDERFRSTPGCDDDRDPIPPGPTDQGLGEDRAGIGHLGLHQSDLVASTGDQVEVVGSVRVDAGPVPPSLEEPGRRSHHIPFRRTGNGVGRHVPDRRNQRSIRLRETRTWMGRPCGHEYDASGTSWSASRTRANSSRSTTSPARIAAWHARDAAVRSTRPSGMVGRPPEASSVSNSPRASARARRPRYAGTDRTRNVPGPNSSTSKPAARTAV